MHFRSITIAVTCEKLNSVNESISILRAYIYSPLKMLHGSSPHSVASMVNTGSTVSVNVCIDGHSYIIVTVEKYSERMAG